MSVYSAKKLADDMIDSFGEYECGIRHDGIDQLSSGDETKATFNMIVYHRDNKPPFEYNNKPPVGVITYKVTVEATYQACEEDE